MVKMILSGCNGKMGQAVTRLCKDRTDLSIVAGFDMVRGYNEKILSIKGLKLSD